MPRTIQLSVNLPNEKGQMARLCRCIADAGINIRAVAVHDCAEAGTVRLVVDDPSGAADALSEAGLAFIETEVLVAELPNKVGALAEAAEKLAEAGVNIRYIYASTGEEPGPAPVVISCTELAEAERVLAGA